MPFSDARPDQFRYTLVTKLSPEVTKLGKVATEFDVYKNGANIFLGGLVASVIAYIVNTS